MLKAKKIWLGNPKSQDSYVDFYGNFDYKNKGRVILKITCDSAFTFYINGGVFFGACADFPFDRRYYTFDITKFSKDKNEFRITVWHFGADSQTCINADAFLAFEIKCGTSVLCTSSSNILACENPNYLSGYKKTITTQLGYSFLYDNTKYGSFLHHSQELGVCLSKKRTVNNLKLLPTPKFGIIPTEQGFIIDLYRETVGFLDIDIVSFKQQKIVFAYGEHLIQGHVPQNIDGREFSVEFIAKKGRNEYLNTFRRIAGRYIEVFVKDIEINRIAIRPAVYPVRHKRVRCKDEIIRKIYDTSVYTLQCCMHEHYEDCPWREQALYTMDSRNQMLCGYYAFYGHSFQRANLVLIAQSIRNDGLLALCAPSGLDLPIPFFTLVFPIQVYEYIQHTGDKSVLKEVENTLRVIKNTFDGRLSDNGLLPAFSPAYGYWNFYEWTEGSDHCGESAEATAGRFDLILNCMYVYASEFFDKLLGTFTDTSKTKSAIQETFYDRESGFYKLDNKSNRYSMLGNAFALLIGLCGEEIADKLTQENSLIPATLSMKAFLYDGLLKCSPKYSEFIIRDILSNYTYMLDNGATTFWETIKGAEDFHGAGSLCHGWSALPIYYFNIFDIFKACKE